MLLNFPLAIDKCCKPDKSVKFYKMKGEPDLFKMPNIRADDVLLFSSCDAKFQNCSLCR